MKKVLFGVGLIVLLTITIVLIRTLSFGQNEVSKPDVATVNIDSARVTKLMSEAISFRTISTGNFDTQTYTAFSEFTNWLTQSFPEVMGQLTLEYVSDHTMLLKWQGKRNDLKPILLTGHYDVVPVVPGTESDWKYPPFSGVVADGFVWGRGAMDDKSAVIVMLEATKLLLKTGFAPERTIYFSFGHDEEVGGPKGAKGVADLLKSRGIQLEWSLDEGSFIGKDIFPGVEHPVASVNVAEKGSVTFDIVAEGRGGHSSMPESEVAIDILAKAIIRLRSKPVPGGLEGVSLEMVDSIARSGPFALRALAANKWLFGGLLDKQLSASPTGNALIRTTTAPTVLRSGVKTNVIAPTATATVNFRLHPRDTPEDIKRHIVSAIDDDRVSVNLHGEGMSTLASGISSRTSDGYKSITKVVHQVFGNEVIIVPGITIAGTDTKHYSKVADNSYRFQYMVVTPDEVSGFHGTNERVSIENLVNGTKAYYLLLKDVASR